MLVYRGHAKPVAFREKDFFCRTRKGLTALLAQRSKDDHYSRRSEERALESLVFEPGARPLFSLARWQSHKNTRRYWRHLRSIFKSSTATNLAGPLLTLATSATLFCTHEQLVLDGITPEWMPLAVVSDLPFSQTSFALSLLLVFRTDSSYSRWLEAVNAWREVRSYSKELVMDCVAYCDDEAQQRMLARWTIAYSKCLSMQLRPSGWDPRVQLAGAHLELEELERLLMVRSDPGFCLQVLTELVLQMELNEVRENKMMQAIASLNKLVGTTKKLISFPLPLAYTRHTSRFMLLYLFLLPLSLWDDLGWLTVGTNVLIAYLLLGIEEIGVQVEEPFAMLPLTEITAEVAADVNTLLNNRRDVQALIKSHGGGSLRAAEENGKS